MIDTDRYEGHTPGPWGIDITIMLEALEYMGPLRGDQKEVNEVDAKLMKDAPLLLDMVKAAHAYSDYVMSGFEEEVEGTGQTYVESGWEPVCFMEFYDNEWQIMKEDEEE